MKNDTCNCISKKRKKRQNLALFKLPQIQYHFCSSCFLSNKSCFLTSHACMLVIVFYKLSIFSHTVNHSELKWVILEWEKRQIFWFRRHKKRWEREEYENEFVCYKILITVRTKLQEGERLTVRHMNWNYRAEFPSRNMRTEKVILILYMSKFNLDLQGKTAQGDQHCDRRWRNSLAGISSHPPEKCLFSSCFLCPPRIQYPSSITHLLPFHFLASFLPSIAFLVHFVSHLFVSLSLSLEYFPVIHSLVCLFLQSNLSCLCFAHFPSIPKFSDECVWIVLAHSQLPSWIKDQSRIVPLGGERYSVSTFKLNWWVFVKSAGDRVFNE